MSRWKKLHLAQMQWVLQEIAQSHHIVYNNIMVADRINIHLEERDGEMIGYHDIIGKVWYLDIDWYNKYFN
jgi:hypothetical protein